MLRYSLLLSLLWLPQNASAQDTADLRTKGKLPPSAEITCSVENLCLTRDDLALLMAARAFRDEGLFALAIKRYELLMIKHPQSSLVELARAELIAVRNVPPQTGPVPLNAHQTPRQSGTFSGILLGIGLGAVSSLGVFNAIDILDEPMIIGTVLSGAGGAYVASRHLKKNPETLGVMESSLLGAIWAPTILMMNLGANEVDLEPLTVLVFAGAAVGGAAGGYKLSKSVNLHAGAATLAWSGALLGGVELALLQNSFFPNNDDEARFIALISAGSLAGMIGGALWARDRKFSPGRGRIMTTASYAAAGLTAATLSLFGVDNERIVSVAAAASFPIGAGLAYLFTEEIEKDEPNAQRPSDTSLAWAINQTEAHSSQ